MNRFLGPRLGDILIDPDNGFGVLRLVTALAVVFSHSFYLLTHVTASEPLFATTGFTLGQHAVHVFFAVSGLLVTASLVRAPALSGFVWARALRIFPALILCTVLTAFVLGPLATNLPIVSYLTSAEPYLYVLKTAGLITGNAALPGVFDANPVPGEVNIPVWTLKYEVICYLILAAAAVLGVFRSWALTTLVLASIAAAYAVPQLAYGVSAEGGSLGSLARLGFCFSLGVLGYVLRDRLRIGALGLVLTGGTYLLLRGTGLGYIALIVLTAYISFAVASLPFGALTRWARDTDISYGTYIYGWPIMQLMVSLVPDISQMQLFLLTLAVLVPLAYLSWRLVEKPALALKSRRRAEPMVSALRQKIVAPRAPIAPGAIVRLDDDGEPLAPPPSQRRINAAIRSSTRDRLRVVSP